MGLGLYSTKVVFLRYQSHRTIDLRWADALLGKAAFCFFIPSHNKVVEGI